MIYKEFLPALSLQDKIECYWQFIVPPSPTNNHQPIHHVVIPHGCPELVFIKNLTFKQNFIVIKGSSTSKFNIDIYPDTCYAGIRIKPGQMKWLSSISKADLLNQHQPCPESSWQPWQQQILESISSDINIEDLFNKSLLNEKTGYEYQPDLRINRVVDRIISDHGKTEPASLAGLAFLSLRQLQRIFKKETGMSLKQFSQIRKLRHAILQLYFKQQNQQEMIIDHNYADLSHFYKSFRNIAQYKLDDFFKYIDQIDHQQMV